MATITINNLNTTGSQLFNDTETYLTDLSEEEIDIAHGGGVCRQPSTWRCSTFYCLLRGI